MRKILLSIKDLSMSFGTRNLFHINKLEIFEGDRIGLVGLNGSGKSTLLRLISGDILPDEGKIKLNCTPCYFMQFSEKLSYISNREELSLFGVKNLQEQEVVSGGESTRIRLAELFSEQGTLHLLDEPTSHLDSDGSEYFEQRLSLIESFILVCHDRELLDRQCNTIVEIESGEVRTYSGNYSSYCEQKKMMHERATREYEIYTDELKRLSMAYQKKKEQARKTAKRPSHLSASEAKAVEYSAPTRSPGSKAKSIERSAESIKKRIMHMEVKERPQEQPQIRPVFSLTDPPQNRVILEANHFSFSYPDGRVIFKDASFRLLRNSRTALLGENGSGKTTLIRLIVEGEQIRKVPKARIGYHQQDLSTLNMGKSVLENALETSIQSQTVVRTVLARLLFTAQDIQKPVSALSGGERIRLSFARIFVSSANVLILDEPTTGLDPQTRRLIWNVISSFRKDENMTVFLTTHYMEEAAEADYVVIIDDGKISAEGTPLELKNIYTGDYITIYGVEEKDIKALNIEYEQIRNGYRLSVPNTKAATELIIRNPQLFNDYEITKGKMDDVFLAVTGKTLVGGAEK